MLKTKLIRANTQVVDGAAGKVHAVVSTEARDRDGDVVRAGGDLKAFMEHPILLASHSYHQLRSQIGEWEEMKVAGALLEGVARYYVGKGNPEADWGFNLASKGMAAYSVGFIPDMARARALGRDDGWSGYEFNGQELLEVSHVTIPSNPDALQRLKAAGIHPAVAEVVEALRSFQRGAPVEGERGLRYTQRHGQAVAGGPEKSGQPTVGPTFVPLGAVKGTVLIGKRATSRASPLCPVMPTIAGGREDGHEGRRPAGTDSSPNEPVDERSQGHGAGPGHTGD